MEYRELIQKRADLTKEGGEAVAALASVRDTLNDDADDVVAQEKASKLIARDEAISAELVVLDGDIGRVEKQRERERAVASSLAPGGHSSLGADASSAGHGTPGTDDR